MDVDGELLKLMSLEDVFRDFKGRRAGIIKALFTDLQELRKKCDPEAGNLCLYASANEQWEVKKPSAMVPHPFPEPVIGINFPQDRMPEKDWLAFVAVHSDLWLLSHAYVLGRNNAMLDKDGRKRLFDMINQLPTVFEVVKAHRQKEEKSNASNNRGSKSKSNSASTQRGSSSGRKKPRRAEKEGNVIEDASFDEEQKNELCEIRIENGSRCNVVEDVSFVCGIRTEKDWRGNVVEKNELCESCIVAESEMCRCCFKKDPNDGVWIRCDECNRWYHGKCEKITPSIAKQTINYRCSCCTYIKPLILDLGIDQLFF